MPRSQSPDVFAMSEANRTHLLARRGDRGGGARKSQPIGIESIYKHKLRKLFRFAQLNYAKKCAISFTAFFITDILAESTSEIKYWHTSANLHTRQSIDNFRRDVFNNGARSARGD